MCFTSFRMESKITNGRVIFCVLLFSYFSCMQCAIYEENKICATLLSGENFDGDVYIAKDWDQSVNIKKDFRSSVTGWNHTRSIKLEVNCTMKICSDTYFEGKCELLSGESVKVNSVINSLSCTCLRECKCQDIFIPKNTYTCGRAYVGDTCNKCESQYIQLLYRENWYSFSHEYMDSVKSITLRKGCNLGIYSGKRYANMRVITNQFVENFNGRIEKYGCSCDDNVYPSPPRKLSVPLMIPTQNNSRSFNNAYILLIGAINPSWIVSLSGCKYVTKTVGECDISVNLPEVDISKPQLRFIYTPIKTNYDDIKSDARWLVTLDEYLSTHEDLKEAIPNAIVIYHSSIDNPTSSDFRRKLVLVNALRGRILDENYSNLIFLFRTQPGEINPEEKLAKFEATIEKYYDFPKPLLLVTRQTIHDQYDKPKINGRWVMPNGEYFLQSFYEKLLLVSEKRGDILGHEIFKASFPFEENEWTVVSSNEVTVVPENHKTLQRHEELLINSTSLGVNSKFACNRHKWSRISGVTWDFRAKMHSFGFIDKRGSPLYICRGFMNSKIRVGSFTFEDGFCRIWFKKSFHLRASAEVLTISGGVTHFNDTDDGSKYRFQYEIVSSNKVLSNFSVNEILPVFAGDTHPKNLNKFIAFESFVDDDEQIVDKIGTARLGKYQEAIFEGNGKRLVAKVFKIFVCTKTKLQPKYS